MRECFLLQWDGTSLIRVPLPDLPRPCAHGAAAVIGSAVYLAGGQSGPELDSAMANVWSLDLASLKRGGGDAQWRELPPWPGPERAFNLAVAQHNGFETCLYVAGGRHRLANGETEFLRDVYEFAPSTGTWRRRADAPVPIVAGAAVAVGQSHWFVPTGDDGALFTRAGELKDTHPGFPRRAWAYHTITDTWIDAGETPANPVTTPAVKMGRDLLLLSGEIRPRIRTADAWKVTPQSKTRSFGAIDGTIVGVYLLAVVGVGVFFTRRNRSANDYFRGGQRIPWWVAGCSIFATMLSSITFMAIPAKAFAQDWVYFIGNLMIIAVAPLAVYLALPFFRRIDATSAYEYLEKRFNRAVRMFASALFTLFHVFRMGIVLSLAALAMTSVTPLSPVQSVLVMGVLSIVYCTLGGIEAVVWTDTLQTLVLLGGALACFAIVVSRTDGGIAGMANIALADGKFRFADPNFGYGSWTIMSLWVVIIGGLGQNISSYTADQAVVQRYMTTPTLRKAARSIWTNAWLTLPASVLFFGLGTALYAFYKTHPDQLDPTIAADQIFPLFLSTQAPAGIAGLVVAGVFAAAQSTVSTSMNSTATTIVTDFLRPLNLIRTERGLLNAGRALTLILGIAGTGIGLMFVRPGIPSLFDAFLSILGTFMGVLGGLFLLGMLTTRGTGAGALAGVIAGVLVVGLIRHTTSIHWFLYAAVGIVVCLTIGYLASLFRPDRGRNLAGLTVYPADKGKAAP